MYLSELMSKAYLKETEPIDGEEITILPSGCKAGVDYNCVITRSDFESIVVNYRASEPASEGILFAIGKARDLNDPIWNVLLDNDYFASHYTKMCNDFYMQRLEQIEKNKNAGSKGENKSPDLDTLFSNNTGGIEFSLDDYKRGVDLIVKDAMDSFSKYGVEKVCCSSFDSVTSFVNKLAEHTPNVSNIVESYYGYIPPEESIMADVLNLVKEAAVDKLQSNDIEGAKLILKPLDDLIYER